jgi:photosystem II stability/assembly factor-like uncharacterized protein
MMELANNPSVPVCLSTNGRTTSSSQQAPLRLLVATTDGIREFTREDGGAPWRVGRSDTLAGHHPSSILHEPRSNLLFAGLHYKGGVVCSEDGGRTWVPRSNGIEPGHVYTLAVQYVGDQTVLYAGTEPAMVYRSDDLGRSWHALSALRNVPDTDKWWFPHATPHVKNIAFHPAEPDTLFACVEQGDLLKSVDAGGSWRPLTSYEKPGDKFRRDMHRVTFRPSNQREVFLTTGTGLYYSADAGESWEQLTNPDFRIGYPDPFFIHPDDESVLFMAGAGESPNPKWGQLGSANPCFMRSTDSGRTWTETMSGMPQPVRGNIEAAAQHKSAAGLEFFVGTACGELYTSRDGAESWTLVTSDFPAVSKGSHYRHFLPPEKRREVEERLRAMKAFG